MAMLLPHWLWHKKLDSRALATKKICARSNRRVFFVHAHFVADVLSVRSELGVQY